MQSRWWVRCVAAAALTTAAWSGLAAQDATVRGVVTDEATARPLAGAIVRISVGASARVTRTSEDGSFQFTRVGAGQLTFSVRILGFEPHTVPLVVVAEMPPLVTKLRRLAMLDTVRVRAAKQGLFGVVATASDLRPLPKATLTIVGIGGGRIPLDSTGHFFVPIRTIGSYFLRAKAAGYEAQTMSVLVSPNEGVEVAFLLDTALKGPSHRLEIAMGDFDERFKKRGLLSALVPRTELMKDPNGGLTNAIRRAPSFALKTMRFGPEACVFVDGQPKPALALDAIESLDVESVEVYGINPRHSDRSGTLAQKWPRLAPCGTTGAPPTTSGDDVVKWVVVWLKH